MEGVSIYLVWKSESEYKTDTNCQTVYAIRSTKLTPASQNKHQ